MSGKIKVALTVSLKRLSTREASLRELARADNGEGAVTGLSPLALPPNGKVVVHPELEQALLVTRRPRRLPHRQRHTDLKNCLQSMYSCHICLEVTISVPGLKTLP